MLGSVGSLAGQQDHDVIEAVARGDGFSDVYVKGLEIATLHDDESYANTFSRFVAAALKDPAKVDVSLYLLDKFAGLNPSHVKAFWHLCDRALEDVKDSGLEGQRATIAWRELKYSLGGMADSSGLPTALVPAIIEDLVDAGLLSRSQSKKSRDYFLTDTGELAYMTAQPGKPIL